MKTKLALISLTLTMFTSCNPIEEDKYDYFTIKVDSVTSPESVKVTDPINLELHGTVGGNGNYSFEKFEIKTKESFTEIRAIGKFDKSGKNATTALVYFGEKVSIQPSKMGEYTLHILQPDNSFIEKKIQIQ